MSCSPQRLAEARYYQRTIPFERYWTEGGVMHRQRPNHPFVAIYVNAVWSPK